MTLHVPIQPLSFSNICSGTQGIFSLLFSSINLDASGKQQGYLQVPYSDNLGGWANEMIPMTIIANGAGPTVLVLGGNHGDEFQRQIAAMKLARELTPEMIAGRIILIPSLNFPAARSATRLSPLDGMNMNRAFPGQPEGAVTSQIALMKPLLRAFLTASGFFECYFRLNGIFYRKRSRSLVDAGLLVTTTIAFEPRNQPQNEPTAG